MSHRWVLGRERGLTQVNQAPAQAPGRRAVFLREGGQTLATHFSRSGREKSFLIYLCRGSGWARQASRPTCNRLIGRGFFLHLAGQILTCLGPSLEFFSKIFFESSYFFL